MSVKKISVMDSGGNLILQDVLTSLPLKEECIIRKSMELFHEGEPCIIQRTIIRKKFFLDMEDYLDKIIKEGKNEISRELVPDWIMELLNIQGKAEKILIN